MSIYTQYIVSEVKLIGIIENLQSALDTWNKYLEEIWNLLTVSPQNFRGGHVWDIVVSVNGSLQAVGYALLVLFFLTGVIRQTTNFNEIKRPEIALRLFIRFAIAKAIISYGMDIMVGIFNIGQGIVSNIMGSLGSPNYATIPQELIESVDSLNLLDKIGVWAISFIGSLVITVLSFIMIYTIYTRFIRLYLFTALAPIPLSTFAGQESQKSGIAFIKSYAGICLEGAVIVLACIIFTALASSPPAIDTSATASKMMWEYVLQLSFNLLVLTGAVKLANTTVKEMLGS